MELRDGWTPEDSGVQTPFRKGLAISVPGEGKPQKCHALKVLKKISSQLPLLLSHSTYCRLCNSNLVSGLPPSLNCDLESLCKTEDAIVSHALLQPFFLAPTLRNINQLEIKDA